MDALITQEPARSLSAPQNLGRLHETQALEQRVPGVFISDVQGNEFTPDLRYRGFAASPLQGTPQGLAVYMQGVRVNEAFATPSTGTSFRPSLSVAPTSGPGRILQQALLGIVRPTDLVLVVEVAAYNSPAKNRRPPLCEGGLKETFPSPRVKCAEPVLGL
jgi:hypothetical protein